MDYKKILEGVVDIINTAEKSDIGFANICTYIGKNCPELKESEDERIRKALIKFHKSTIDIDGIKGENVLAWLEKQETSYTKRDVDDAYLKGVTDTKNEIEKRYEANYQIRKDIATFIFNYRGNIKDRAKWIDYLGIKVSFVKMQGEQNKPAWSEEDESRMDNLCHFLDEYGDQYYGHLTLQGTISWLKSIKERYIWKPSDEQMKALNYVVNLMASSKSPNENDYYYNVLKDLRKQLKKWN